MSSDWKVKGSSGEQTQSDQVKELWWTGSEESAGSPPTLWSAEKGSPTVQRMPQKCSSSSETTLPGNKVPASSTLSVTFPKQMERASHSKVGWEWPFVWLSQVLHCHRSSNKLQESEELVPGPKPNLCCLWVSCTTLRKLLSLWKVEV